MENSTELESIRGVGYITADKLRLAGYDSFEKLAAASPEELKERLGLNVTIATNIISAADDMVRETTPELPEEPEPLPAEASTESSVQDRSCLQNCGENSKFRIGKGKH